MTMHFPKLASSVFLCSVSLLAACGDDGASGNNGSVQADARTASADAAPAPLARNGLVRVRTALDFSHIELHGEFLSGPKVEYRTETDAANGCRLLSFTPSFCDPFCDGFDVCVDGECKAWPQGIDQGTIRWTWPGGSKEVSSLDGYYSESGMISEEGTTSVVVGGETLELPTIEAPVEANNSFNIPANREGDLVLQWSPTIPDTRVRLKMTDCTGSHGGIGEVEIDCDVPDEGQLVIPEAFMDALDGANWSRGECGQHFLERYRSIDSADESFRFESQSRSDFFYRPGSKF